MNYIKTTIPGAWIIEPKVFNDARGYFFESFKQSEFEESVGPVAFIQENESRSSRGILRGLHYQLAPFSQAKLVRVIVGCVLDVAVDLRRGSPAFGLHIAVELSSENKRQLFIPQGFAHGFHVLSEEAVFVYKVDNPYSPASERSIRYDDPALGIDWRIPCSSSPILSEKDKQAPLLMEGELNFVYNHCHTLNINIQA
ncbi:MAG: dTDP-4-dehydrorhamnose 3,5-epimerase [Tannerellaceae bacterium]|jgi:dTDP-4-dehydrorhamnose 3,5-epimerase|nr:dTDP-4-dehydrorhamnose 3,5-epimerase [Tannerellaceae bacterium]